MKKGRKKAQKEPKIIFKQADGISEEEMQRNLESAFNTLFNAVIKKRNSE